MAEVKLDIASSMSDSDGDCYSTDGRLDKEESAGLLEPSRYQVDQTWLRRVFNIRPHSASIVGFVLPWTICFILAIALILIGVKAGLEETIKCRPSPDDQNGAYSPAEEAVGYVPVTFGAGFGHTTSPYQGFPTDETDALWEDLYEYGVTLHVDSATHDRLLNKSEHVPVRGYEGDYLVGLDVFHQLHCLNQIRMAFYPRRYNVSMVNADGSVKYLQWLHIDHCIDSIRQSLMCNADTSLITYDWLKSNIMEPQLRTVHMCRDFGRLREWAFERYVNFTTNKRRHVEHGVIVDYTNRGVDPEDEKAAETYLPEGWNYTVEDL